jgi:RNA-binding protein YlmH
MTKEEQMLQKRLIELSRTAYQRGIVIYSDFLNLNEQNILHSIPKNELYCSYECWGGYDLAERQMAAFLPDALCFGYNYPITPLEVRPLNTRFSDKLNHRDYLGVLMNLGIERKMIGDIAVNSEAQTAVIFTQDKTANFIIEELTRIRHTSVMAVPAEEDLSNFKPKTVVCSGTVASLRLDAILAIAFPMSRSKLTAFISEGRVFINGRLTTSNSNSIRENDLISVRGLGKFRFASLGNQSRKGRYFVEIEKYI